MSRCRGAGGVGWRHRMRIAVKSYTVSIVTAQPHAPCHTQTLVNAGTCQPPPPTPPPHTHTQAPLALLLCCPATLAPLQSGLVEEGLLQAHVSAKLQGPLRMASQGDRASHVAQHTAYSMEWQHNGTSTWASRHHGTTALALASTG